MGEYSSIQATPELMDVLHERKDRGESYEDVIWRLLEGEPASAPRDDQEAASVDVDGLDLPGRGEVEEQRRDAVRAVYEHVRAEGRASRSDLEEIAVEIAGETYSDSNSLWKNCIQPALSDLEGVEAEGPSGYWRTT